MSMKPKAALIEDGKVPTKMGKGRMSAKQIARCKELAAQGWDIEGFAVTKSVATAEKPATTTVSKVATSTEKVISDFTERFPVTTPVHGFIDGHRIKASMREICFTCGVSLVQCWCGAPSIVRPDGRGFYRVYIDGDH